MALNKNRLSYVEVVNKIDFDPYSIFDIMKNPTTVLPYSEKIIEFGDYISEALYLTERLPIGIIDKSTGAGATTFALKNHFNTIVAVPSINLVADKVKEFKGAVHGCSSGFTKWRTKVSEYLKSYTHKKFIVVYDSLDSLLKLLKEQAPEVEFQLIIDEYHCYLTEYGYRKEALSSMLQQSTPYIKRNLLTLISATPLKGDELPIEWRMLPKTTFVSTNVDKISTAYIKQTKRPLEKFISFAKDLIRDGVIILEGEITNEKHLEAYNNHIRTLNNPLIDLDNLYTVQDLNKKREYCADQLVVFINSVTAIISLIKKLNLKESQVTVLVGKGNYNETRLKAELGTEFRVGVKETTTQFTFVTSTGFEGLSIDSIAGVSFVLSVSNKIHTLLSQRQLKQIAGRIRTKAGPFRDDIRLIYNTTLTKTDEISELVEATKHKKTYNQVLESKKEFRQTYDRCEEALKRIRTFDKDFWLYSKEIFKIDHLPFLKETVLGEVIWDEAALNNKKNELNKYDNYSYLTPKRIEDMLNEDGFRVKKMELTQEEQKIENEIDVWVQNSGGNIPKEEIKKEKAKLYNELTEDKELSKALKAKINPIYLKLAVDNLIKYNKLKETEGFERNTRYEMENTQLNKWLSKVPVNRMETLKYNQCKIDFEYKFLTVCEEGKEEATKYLKTLIEADPTKLYTGTEVKTLSQTLFINVLLLPKGKYTGTDLRLFVEIKETKNKDRQKVYKLNLKTN